MRDYWKTNERILIYFALQGITAECYCKNMNTHGHLSNTKQSSSYLTENTVHSQHEDQPVTLTEMISLLSQISEVHRCIPRF